MGGRRALGGEQTPALHPARLRAWLHHADGRRRGPVQGGQLLRARVRRQYPLERPRHRRRLAHRARHPVGQGYEGADVKGARGDVAELCVSGVSGGYDRLAMKVVPFSIPTFEFIQMILHYRKE